MKDTNIKLDVFLFINEKTDNVIEFNMVKLKSRYYFNDHILLNGSPSKSHPLNSKYGLF